MDLVNEIFRETQTTSADLLETMVDFATSTEGLEEEEVIESGDTGEVDESGGGEAGGEIDEGSQIQMLMLILQAVLNLLELAHAEGANDAPADSPGSDEPDSYAGLVSDLL